MATFSCLSVTKCNIYPFKENVGRVKALATIVLNDQIQIRGLRVADGEDGQLTVEYPNDPFYRGDDFRSIVCILSDELKDHIQTCVVEKYNAVK